MKFIEADYIENVLLLPALNFVIARQANDRVKQNN